MEKPTRKFNTMGTSAASGTVNASGMPERGTLVKRKNTASGDLSGKKGGQVMKHVTSKKTYGITTTMPSYVDPQIGPTQGNGRLFKAATNRTAVNFTDGMTNYN